MSRERLKFQGVVSECSLSSSVRTAEARCFSTELDKDAELQAKIDEISQRFIGFYFGSSTYVRRQSTTSEQEELQDHRVDGVTSEATHIYDPKKQLIDASRVCLRNGARVRDRRAQSRSRVQAGSAKELFAMLSEYRQRARLHFKR